MSIQPLPADVVAQIKSSIIITSLNSVICELLKNSLDAGATRIDIFVDYGKGTCIVEDDGSGITPGEFGGSGGLGKLYHSSKLNSPHPVHGGQGTFLASLSAMSVLSIVSHHRSHRSHNMITMHKSEVVARQTPAPTQQHLISFSHGTRIVVRDLFGNLPVRVKQRAIMAEKHQASTKEWDDLKRDVVALLLAWPNNVTLSMKDSGSSRKLNIRPSTEISDVSETNGDLSLSRLCSILSQAFFISPDEKDSWVSVEASTPKLRITGAISLEPSAIKHVQFFSYGARPLKQVEGPSILHDEINRLFSNSAFGSNEEIEELSEVERRRRAQDNRFKGDGYTDRELKGAGKGVDRWPMFYINIQHFVPRAPFGGLDMDRFLDDKFGELGTIVELLQVMVVEFLTRNHFRPKAGRFQKSKRTKSTSPSKKGEFGREASSQKGSLGTSREKTAVRRSKPTFDQFGTNVKLPSFRNSTLMQESPFATWSKAKSGLPSSKSQTAKLIPGYDIQRPSTAPPAVPFNSINYNDPLKLKAPTQSTHLPSEIGDIPRRPFEDVDIPKRRARIAGSSAECSQQVISAGAKDDDLITWTNPVTKAVSLVNQRTGLSVPASRSARALSSTLTLSSRKTLEQSSSTAEPSPWVQEIFKAWDNPVFAPTGPAIPHVQIEGLDAISHDLLHDRNHHCSQIDIDRAFKDVSAGIRGRLSKAALRDAQVISQVDKKFILVKLSTTGDKNSDHMLVLIDQHAADERIRIESLMEELCTSPSKDESAVPTESRILTTPLSKPLHFEISLRDSILLQRQRPHFVNWGIIYQTPEVASAVVVHPGTKPNRRLTVVSLPPGIAERCKAEPRLLIDLIRVEVYKINEQSYTKASQPLSHHSPWVERIHTCPQGLIDMLNSRACRSAIMFNDELSTAQCEMLVKKLSRCIFPFQCAHGRPSLVPLVEVGQLGEMGGLLKGEDGGGFRKEMQRWRGRGG